MLQQTLAVMATEFAATLIRTLRAAPIEELSRLLAETDAHAASPQARADEAIAVTRQARADEAIAATPTGSPPPRRHAPRASARAEPPPAPAAVTVDDSRSRDATIAYYAERGAKGATARQVSEHLAGLGLDGDASDRIVDALLAAGAVRDAGFRRAAGRNATAAVYVATLPST
jgi:hypothetical protein